MNDFSISDIRKLVDDFSSLKIQGIVNFIHVMEEYDIKRSDFVQNNKNASYDFNIFRLFSMKETLHSLFLGNLLNPNAAHGQGNIFLNSFLKQIGVENAELGRWIVTVERRRVDILLRRKNPYSVIIIENKSNDAGDQPNQLYRYWYREIFAVSNANAEKVSPSSRAIVYLTSGDEKALSNNSIMKPEGWPDYLPDKVPIEPITLRFNREIISWLSNLLGELSGNHRMTELITQYIEYWETR
ncbi:MAG: PD-(D/E)XK nuclease family protein [Prolixibacteraceae bacterium]|nr:PD-(D/E)XK nuclease family protein [Prolixibacteraceae bacterium]